MDSKSCERFQWHSLLLGGFLALLFASFAILPKCVINMYEVGGVPKPTEMLIAVPSWTWLVIGIGSCIAVIWKDRFISPNNAYVVNWAVAISAALIGALVIACSFRPFVGPLLIQPSTNKAESIKESRN